MSPQMSLGPPVPELQYAPAPQHPSLLRTATSGSQYRQPATFPG